MSEFITQVNPRLKGIKLQFCPYRGLIISSPKKLSNRKLAQLCLQHKHWIEQQRQKHNGKNTHLETTLNLLALEKSYSIQTHIDNNKLTLSDETISIMGENEAQQIDLLKKWIRKQAIQFYQQRIDFWSQKTGLFFKKLSVRSQKSRWGSCSSNGTISLNDQLLFMPSTVLDYIIVHELCHTVEANHSLKYWQCVENHYPNYQHQEQLLSQSVKLIPDWFRASLYT
ncbi:MAG: M48 family metallopeptidase [Gammaproteobacteria bacterium]|nr:M48 family metallopeptidase [Gammaproteobacteria bacterium]